jgi:hypothetical protein
MMTNDIASAAGWRAREIRVDKPDVTVADIFRAVTLKDGRGTLYDLMCEEQGLKPEFALFIGGELLRGACDWQRPVMDSEQIHVVNWPMTDA